MLPWPLQAGNTTDVVVLLLVIITYYLTLKLSTFALPPKDKPTTCTTGTQTMRPCNKGRTTPQNRPRCHSNGSDPGYLASDSSDHESPSEEDKRSLITRNTSSPERHLSRPQSLSDTSDSDSNESHYMQHSGGLSKTQLASPQTPSRVQAGEPAIITRDKEQHKSECVLCSCGENQSSSDGENYVQPKKEQSPQTHGKNIPSHPACVKIIADSCTEIKEYQRRSKEQTTFTMDILMEIQRNKYEQDKLLAKKNEQINQLCIEKEELKKQLKELQAKTRRAGRARPASGTRPHWLDRNFLRFL